MLQTNAILHLIKKQGSSSRCQRREARLKCTDLRSYNIAEDDGNSDNDADDDHHELSDVDNVDDDHNLRG